MSYNLKIVEKDGVIYHLNDLFLIPKAAFESWFDKLTFLSTNQL